MSPPTYLPGQVLASADVNNWFVPLVAQKTSNQSVTSSTTPVNDTQLVLTFAINTTYWLQGVILFDAANGGDIKINFTIPAGATMNCQGNYRITGTGVDVSWITMNASQLAALGNGAGSTQALSFFGPVAMSSTAGATQMVWAQNTSNATATRVLTGSVIMATRIS
jgi:hypothetical protein